MSRLMRPASEYEADQLGLAVEAMRLARMYLYRADCEKTMLKVKSALKSAEGAQRHMQRRLAHAEAGQ